NYNMEQPKTKNIWKPDPAKGWITDRAGYERLLSEDRIWWPPNPATGWRSEEHTSELQSRENIVCRLLLEKKNCSEACSGILKTSTSVCAPFVSSSIMEANSSSAPFSSESILLMSDEFSTYTFAALPLIIK